METTTKTTTSPVWPYPDIVRMGAHKGSGQWRKTYGGKQYYFGPLDDPENALARWPEEWPRITNGEERFPRPGETGTQIQRLSLIRGLKLFLRSKKDAYDLRHIVWPTFREYRYICRLILKSIDTDRNLATVGPEDFRKVYRQIADYTPTRKKNTVVKIRSVFQMAL